MQRTIGLDVLNKTMNYVGKRTLDSQIDFCLHLTIFMLFIHLFT